MGGAMKGRGATSNPAGRFDSAVLENVDDGWYREAEQDSIASTVEPDHARSVITTNDSPDIPFEQSINPYRGCEHGCIYCYARPTHAYLGLSPGLDFETRLFYKQNAAALLEAQLAKPGYVCKPVMLGANTDPYQPIERRLGVTRAILEVLARQRHPVAVVTKGALIERDLDLLADLAREKLVSVMISIPTLDVETKRVMEPRAASPAARLRVVEKLAQVGVPVGVMVAPIIPAITDHELESILEAAKRAGAASAAYVVLRLPYEVNTLFQAWLAEHYPRRAAHVMSLVRAMRGGVDNDSRFGSRMRGTGPYAQLLRSRFAVTCRKLNLHSSRVLDLDTSRFLRPKPAGAQLDLAF